MTSEFSSVSMPTCECSCLTSITVIHMGTCGYILSFNVMDVTTVHVFLSSPSLFDVFPARAPENTTLLMGVDSGEGRNAGIQAGYQLALLFSTLIISILGGLLTG